LGFEGSAVVMKGVCRLVVAGVQAEMPESAKKIIMVQSMMFSGGGVALQVITA
jgi:hypothetical protein